MRLWYCKDAGGMPRVLFYVWPLSICDYGKGHHAYGFRYRAFDIGRYAFVLCLWR